MTAEVIDFSDLLDAACTLASAIKELYDGQEITVRLFTYSTSLLGVISKGSRTSEKRLMIEIARARESFRTHAASGIGFVGRKRNAANGLKKDMHQATLQEILRSGRLKVCPEQ